jgi:hypothetical protein
MSERRCRIIKVTGKVRVLPGRRRLTFNTRGGRSCRVSVTPANSKVFPLNSLVGPSTTSARAVSTRKPMFCSLLLFSSASSRKAWYEVPASALTASARRWSSVPPPISMVPRTVGVRSTLRIMSDAFTKRSGAGLMKFRRLADPIANSPAARAGTGTAAARPPVAASGAVASTWMRYSSKA